MMQIITIVIYFLSILLVGTCYAQAPISSSGFSEQSVEQRLDRLERMLQSRGLLDLIQNLEQLEREISVLRGEIEVQNYALEELTRRQRNLYIDVDQRIQKMEQVNQPVEEGLTFSVDGPLPEEPPLETLTSIANPEDSSSTVNSNNTLQIEIIGGSPARSNSDSSMFTTETTITSSTPPLETETDPEENSLEETLLIPVDPVQLQAEYQQAFNLLRQSRYNQAISAFQQFLAIHPSDKYSDNAQYWLAETYYVKREFQQALIEYNNVVSKFPNSQKVNDALLKIGFSLYETGEIESAKVHLQELVGKLPGTTVARLADERIKLINSNTQNISMPSD